MAIISISGKLKSGKNLTASIIQYLIWKDNVEKGLMNLNNYTLKNFEESNLGDILSGWQQKAFARKLKQIVSILTGISVEDLEKQEVKDRVLGEEWNRYLLKEYWINDEYAEHEQFTYFASNEDMQKYIINMGHTDSTCSQVGKTSITVRQLLQELGTEAMRNQIHPNIWCISLFSDYIEGDLEIWKDVKGYEQYYQISNFGRIKRKARKAVYGDVNKGEYHNYDDLILKPTKSGYYLTVKFLNKETVRIHRLVAEHFIENTENKPYVNHIDQNPLNNFYKNLEWCTQSENIISANKAGNGNIGEKQFDAKLNEEKVLKIKELLKTNMQQKEIAKMFNVGQTTITDIKKRRKWKHIGVKKQPIAPILPKSGSNWLITDTRFPNELQAVKERGGITIRVNRDFEQLRRDKGIYVPKHLLTSEHPSETALDSATFDYVIENNGSIEDLIEKIKEVLIKEKLI